MSSGASLPLELVAAHAPPEPEPLPLDVTKDPALFPPAPPLPEPVLAPPPAPVKSTRVALALQAPIAVTPSARAATIAPRCPLVVHDLKAEHDSMFTSHGRMSRVDEL